MNKEDRKLLKLKLLTQLGSIVSDLLDTKVKDLNLEYDNIDHESKIEDIEIELESASQALEYTILDLTKNRI